jgi:hypothetical protein
VYFYNYGEDIYSFQGILKVLSKIVGLASLFFAILGYFMPIGKPIVIESLSVVQIAYFSVIQFKKIPPTFIGLENLIYSNGYKDSNILSANNYQNSDVFNLIGMNSSILSDCSISLLFLFILPVCVGLMGCLIVKLLKKRSVKDSNA